MYRFGPGKSYLGNEEEWTALKAVIVTRTFPSDKVICPHCGAANRHGAAEGHKDCDGSVLGAVVYDCPGYVLKNAS